VGGLRLVCYIALGSVVTFPSAVLLHFLRFCCYISFGSDASWDWVRTLHVIRLVCYIAVGSDGSLGSVGSRRIDHPGRYMYRGVERSWFYIFVNYPIIALSSSLSYQRRQHPFSLSSFFLPLLVVCGIGPGIGPSVDTSWAHHLMLEKRLSALTLSALAGASTYVSRMDLPSSPTLGNASSTTSR